MSIIWTIISGLIIGVIAKMFVHGPGEPQGFILTAILGIVGAFVGSFISNSILHLGIEGGLMWWVMSILGAVVVLIIWGVIAKRNA